MEIIPVLQCIRERAASESCWGPGKLRRRQEKGGEGVADDASFTFRIQAEGTKMFGSVGLGSLWTQGTSIITGPSDSSKQLHRPLGQCPAWRSECSPGAGKGLAVGESEWRRT